MGCLVREELLAKGFEVLGSYDVDNIAELDDAAPSADVVIDFSAPAALPHTLAYVRRTGAAVVCGTTGRSPVGSTAASSALAVPLGASAF